MPGRRGNTRLHGNAIKPEPYLSVGRWLITFPRRRMESSPLKCSVKCFTSAAVHRSIGNVRMCEGKRDAVFLSIPCILIGDNDLGWRERLQPFLGFFFLWLTKASHVDFMFFFELDLLLFFVVALFQISFSNSFFFFKSPHRFPPN